MEYWGRYAGQRQNTPDALWDSEALPEYLATLHNRRTWPSMLNDGPNTMLYVAIDEFSRFQPRAGMVAMRDGAYVFCAGDWSDHQKARAIVSSIVPADSPAYDEHGNVHMATAVHLMLQQPPDVQQLLRTAAPMSALVFLMGRGGV